MVSRKKGTSRRTSTGKAYRVPSSPAARVSEPALAIRRKNFDLDQARLDQLRVALGAKTEREAIVSAMEIALDVLAFEHELDAGATAMFGTGGFRDEFDQPGALEFKGFAPSPRRSAR